MSPTSPLLKDKAYPAPLRDILERANRGDESALPELKQTFDEHPELAALLGDLVQHAEDALLRWATGTCLAAREAIARQVAELRARLSATANSELEKLLIDRICISWIEVYAADVQFTERMANGMGTGPAAQVAQKVLDRAHQRFLTAVRALATVQKLTRPALTPIQIATRLKGSPRAGDAMDTRRKAAIPDGAAVAN
jgi:hypothetical protein